MSRVIDDNRPFTEEEKAYIRNLGVGLGRIDVNDRRFGHLSEDEKRKLRGEAEADDKEELAAQKRQQEAAEEDWHEEDLQMVAPLTVPQLKENLTKFEVAFDSKASKEELQLALLEFYDARRRASEGNTETPEEE